MKLSSSRVLARAFVVSCVLAVLGAAFATRAVARADTGADVDAHGARTRARERTPLDGEPRARYPSAPQTLSAGGQSLLAFPPVHRAGERPRSVVYLHGIHGRAANGCPWFRAGASEVGWLVCPEANVRNTNGTASWGGDLSAQNDVVTRALRAAEANGASPEPGVAIGFSQGGYVTLDLVLTGRARFRGLVLMAAPGPHPSARELRSAGVERVAFASGALDAAHDALVDDAKRLQREGFDARFFDLGRVGHTYIAEDPSVLREAIVWAGSAPEDA